MERELKEELGIGSVRCGDIVFSAPDPGSEFIIDFVEVTIDGEPQSIEHSELRWVAPRTLRDLPLAPGDKKFAEFLVKRTGS